MEKGIGAESVEAAPGALAAPAGMAGMAAPAESAGTATVARPATGQTSIADTQPKRPTGQSGGTFSGSITPEEGPAAGGTLARDEQGNWSYSAPDGEIFTYDGRQGRWTGEDGKVISWMPPEDVAAVASGTLDAYTGLLDNAPDDAAGRRP